MGILDVIEFQKPSFKHVCHIIIILIIQPVVKWCHVISPSRVTMQFLSLFAQNDIFYRKRHQICKSNKYGLSSYVLILNKNTLSIKESHHRLFWRSINFLFLCLNSCAPVISNKKCMRWQHAPTYTYRCLTMFISSCLRHV